MAKVWTHSLNLFQSHLSWHITSTAASRALVTFRSVVHSSTFVTLRVLLLLQKCCTARLGVVVRCCHQYNINFKSMLLDFYICFAGKIQLKIQSKAVCSLTFYFQTVALSVLHMQLLHVIKFKKKKRTIWTPICHNLFIVGGVLAAVSGGWPKRSRQLELHSAARSRHQGQDRRLHRWAHKTHMAKMPGHDLYKGVCINDSHSKSMHCTATISTFKNVFSGIWRSRYCYFSCVCWPSKIELTGRVNRSKTENSQCSNWLP